MALRLKKDPVMIHTPRKYAIQAIVEWGPRNSQLGWNCQNGDVLKLIADFLLNGRYSAAVFIHVPHEEWVSRSQGQEADMLLASGGNSALPPPKTVKVMTTH